MYIIKIHTKINHCKNHSYKDRLLSQTTEQKNILQPVALIGYPFLVVAKSTAEPQNSYDLTLANDSTPLTRAFFVRSLRTPQERLELQESPERLSMVGRNGKGSPFAASQCLQFLSPLRSTAQTLRSLAVVSKKLTLELSKMLFKFLLLGEKRLTVRIRAKSETEARQRLNLSKSTAICIARFSDNLTACNGNSPQGKKFEVNGNAVHPTNTISFQAQGGIYA